MSEISCRTRIPLMHSSDSQTALTMDQNNTAMLQYASAVPEPLRLRVRDPQGAEEKLEISSAFAIIGRSNDAHVCLPDQRVSFRHVLLQAIGNRICCTDLLSTSGTKVNGKNYSGWITHEDTLQVCGYELQLLDDCWAKDDSLKAPTEFRPRDEQRAEYGTLPRVELTLLNTSAKGKSWPINRVLTLVGRDDRCRITVVDDRLSRVQCALLLLPSGLWIIDLLGKSEVLISGEPVKCGLLAEGVEVGIGPYRLTAHYPELQQQTQTALTQSGEFLTKQNKIVRVEAFADTLIVVPIGDSQSFLYSEIHVEASRITELIRNKGFRNLVIDFRDVETIGQLVVEALTAFCRQVPGKAALCNSNAEVFSKVQRTTLGKVWPHYLSREDAIQAVYYHGNS